MADCTSMCETQSHKVMMKLDNQESQRICQAFESNLKGVVET